MFSTTGKPKDAGILPRALDVIFNSINGKQWPNNRLKPKMFMDVMKLSTDQAEEDLKIKERTMKMVTFEVCLFAVSRRISTNQSFSFDLLYPPPCRRFIQT